MSLGEPTENLVMNSGKIDFSPFIVDIGRLYGGERRERNGFGCHSEKKRPFQHGIEKKEKNISLSIGCQQESKEKACSLCFLLSSLFVVGESH